MAALAKSTVEVTEVQLTQAGPREFFERALSADNAKRLKPAREAYHVAAQRLGIAPWLLFMPQLLVSRLR